MSGPIDPRLSERQVDRYVGRLGFDPRGAPTDLATLRALHLAHLERVPFENLDIVFGDGVTHDRSAAVDKIVGDGRAGGRGGWCFELNGAFGLLLEALGYDVRLLGAAVLHDGPTQVIEHLLLEVASPLLEPHLVDVGFGDSFDVPLAVNTSRVQPGGSGDYQLIASPQGTTLTRHVDGVPAALLRFKRVAHDFDDFAAVAASMQVDPDRKWASHPFATRRLTGDERGSTATDGVQRVTITQDRLKVQRGSRIEETPVDRAQWRIELERWFGIVAPDPARPED